MPAKREGSERLGLHRPEGDPPRLREMPPPRRSKGIIGPAMGTVFAWPYRVALAGLYRAGFLPWQLTMLSLATNGVIGYLLITGRRFLPGGLMIAAGLLDIFDGGVARLRGEASRAGAFLDSVVDRVSDVILFGCLYWSLAGQGHRLLAGLSLASLFVSLLVSYIRAAGESLGLSPSEGVFQRLERYVVLLVGLMVPGALLPALLLLTGLGGFTVLQRTVSVWRGLEASGLDRRRGQVE
jgi:phosphatidylinositol phosphate synthase